MDRVAQRGFFGALEPESAAALRAVGVVRQFGRGIALFHERQAADRVFVLLVGTVKLISISEDGKEVLLALRGPGDLLGELGAVDGEPRSATAIALVPVEALVVPLADFSAFLEQRPKATLLILQMVVRRLRDADRKRVEFAAQDSMSRVAASIVEMCDGSATSATARSTSISPSHRRSWRGGPAALATRW